MSLAAPQPPAGSFKADAAARGKAVFDAKCGSCHVGGSGTDNNSGRLHDPKSTGMDPAYAMRTKTKKYRATPLRALWQHPPYFHDGSAKDLGAVVEHYDETLSLKLDGEQRKNLVEYLKSL
jgi:cytochrome c peroxidase